MFEDMAQKADKNKDHKLSEAEFVPVCKKVVEEFMRRSAVCSDANDIDAHWTVVAKNSGGRVTAQAFDNYFMSTAFGKAVPDKLKAQYKDYLNDIFSTGWAMMPHKDASETPTLGGHCFRSVANLPF